MEQEYSQKESNLGEPCELDCYNLDMIIALFRLQGRFKDCYSLSPIGKNE